MRILASVMIQCLQSKASISKLKLCFGTTRYEATWKLLVKNFILLEIRLSCVSKISLIGRQILLLSRYRIL